jgi:hypothetical protein
VDKKPLLVINLCAVVLLVLASLGNVVGYQTVQSSQQNPIKERINQRELLFQTICDIANNKTIQRIILTTEMKNGRIPRSEIPVFTMKQLKQMYFLGLIFSKGVGTSKIHSMIQQFQFHNQEMQMEISAVIEKDVILRDEIAQLQTSECDCENENTGQGRYPLIICTTLFLIVIGVCAIGGFFELLTVFLHIEFFTIILTMLVFIAAIPFLLAVLVFNCFDYPSNI